MKTKLETLIEKITPLLPLEVGRGKLGARSITGGTKRLCTMNGESVLVREDQAAYLVHAANNFPKLLEAAELIRCPAENIKGHETLRCMRCWCYGIMLPALTQAREVKG